MGDTEITDALNTLFSERLGLIARLVDITKQALEANGDNDSVMESYVAAIDERETIITRLRELDSEILVPPFYENGKPALMLSEIFRQHEKSASHLAKGFQAESAKLDRLAHQLMLHVRTSIREINEGQNLSAMYQYGDMDVMGTLIDKKK